MHPGQADLTTGHRARPRRRPFPQWRNLPSPRSARDGTVNALFRLGDDIVLRFPLNPSPTPPSSSPNRTTPACSSPRADPVPEPVALGAQGRGTPGLLGRVPLDRRTHHHPAHVAPADLAASSRALHGVDTGGQPWNGPPAGARSRQDDWVATASPRAAT